MAIDFSNPSGAQPKQETPRQRRPQPGPRPSALQDPLLRAYITEYSERQRENDAKATEASNRWLRRKTFLVAYCAKNNYSEHAARQKYRDDYELSDAMDAWSWHMREAARCHAAVDTAIKMAKLADGTL